MSPPRFTVAERRARIGARHRLAPHARATSVEEVAASLVALHSTDPATVVLSAWARLADGAATAAEVEDALYEQRTLLRLLAMRRTMFVVDRATAPVVHAATSLAVARQERRKLLAMLEEAGIGGARPAAWLARAERAALAELEARGAATAVELNAAHPLLGTEIVLGAGTKWEARQKIGSRVLLVLAAEGQVVRARPRGGWTSTQFRWARLDDWAGPGALPELPAEAAEAELARRWLASYGPAALEDLKWWTGWTARQVKRAVGQLDVVEVELDDGTPGVVLADDAAPIAAAADSAPWVALLPALDPTPMGYKRRGFYLGDHAERLFDVNGNASPTVWVDGRIAGGWARRPDGEVVFTLLEDVGAEAGTAVARAAAALAPRLGDAKLAPRARGYSSVERELLR